MSQKSKEKGERIMYEKLKHFEWSLNHCRSYKGENRVEIMAMTKGPFTLQVFFLVPIMMPSTMVG